MSTQTQLQDSTDYIANRLTYLCQQGKYSEAQIELYADHAISIEPTLSMQPEAAGLDAIQEKSADFRNNIAETHSNIISEPIIAGNHFAITITTDVTMKDGSRVAFKEVAVYKVAAGKIVAEQFFY